MDLFYIGLSAFLGLVLGLVFRGFFDKAASAPPGDQPKGTVQNKDSLTEELFGLSDSVAAYLNQAANPSDLLRHPVFARGVEILGEEPFEPSDLLKFYNGDNFLLSCMAVEALSRRTDGDDDLSEPLLRTMSTMATWTRWFALRALSARGNPPLVGRVVKILDDSWENRFSYLFLREFFQQRFDAGESPDLSPWAVDLDEWQAENLAKILKQVGSDVTQGLLDNLDKSRQSGLDINYLSSVGKIWDQLPDEEIITHEALIKKSDELLDLFRRDRRRSALIVGPPGTGSTTLLRYTGWRLQQEGWTIFEASANEVAAGQSFIGQIEDRVQILLRNLGGEGPVLWIVPRFHELMWAGRHMKSPVSVLDRIMPAIEQGEIYMVGDIGPEACDRLLRRFPRLKAAMELLRIDPLPEEQALILARGVAQKLSSGGTSIPETILPEAYKLCEQYLGRDSSPGHVLDLLKRTVEKKTLPGDSGDVVTSRDLLVTLSDMTGLPPVILDEQESLDLGSLREFFEARVLGQLEAVDCLVDRVAMIKAGLTDPTRPLGVFIFAGPTGTGKTELAKALAEFLFGSADRMIRLDMSEFQTSDSLERILGAPGMNDGHEALADRIRNQPFAVVLLDEFEKAHQRIWDVFLQLFDDGRLTDRSGNTADFRHAIVIMTSNLGGYYDSHIGFGSEPVHTATQNVGKEFTREFLNRIDRIVVFRALNRSTMREILMKELEEALGRRGLRTRQWAVEWESSAIDFLLTRGFTDDLGARPLKRAIERYLLSPLATTIVNHQFPEGDQFLFVRSDGEEIEVAFVDPDEPDEDLFEATEPERPGDEPARVRDLALAPRGNLEEVELLKEHYAFLRDLMEEEQWTGNKRSLMEAMNHPEFWKSEERYITLGKAEYMDRLEEGMRTAGSLLDRLARGAEGRRDRFSISLIKRVAQRIYLVEAACRGLEENAPRDAYVLIEARPSLPKSTGADADFALKILGMYTQWAKRRGMQCESLLERPGGTDKAYRAVLAISGFAVYPILAVEQGIHEMEVPGSKGKAVHQRVHVRVSPQSEEPIFGGRESELAQAEAVFSATEPGNLHVVRRYREEPSPLVRDSVRKFRTGRIDLVWRGDFDLF